MFLRLSEGEREREKKEREEEKVKTIISPCRNRVVRPDIEATDALSDESLNSQTVER